MKDSQGNEFEHGDKLVSDQYFDLEIRCIGISPDNVGSFDFIGKYAGNPYTMTQEIMSGTCWVKA